MVITCILGLCICIMPHAKVYEYVIQLDMCIFTDRVWLVVEYAVVCATFSSVAGGPMPQPCHSPVHGVEHTYTRCAKYLL